MATFVASAAVPQPGAESHGDRLSHAAGQYSEGAMHMSMEIGLSMK
jgi:hypothetical protein